MHQFDIKPYLGVGKLKFGMTQNEVIEILGKPEETNTHPSGDLYGDRFNSSVLTIYTKSNNKLSQVGFSRWTKNLIYKEVDIFSLPSNEVLNFLIDEDGQPYESLGFIVLLELGITLTGFHDDDEDDKAVTVFTKGRWDSKIQRLKPFKYSPKSYHKK